MNREYRYWYSPGLGREMELLIFGHAGARVLAFPPFKGHFFDWENQGMIDVLKEPLEQGWLHLFCVDSIDEESWGADWIHPSARAWRHIQYEQYLLNEFFPMTMQCNPNPYFIVVGVDFGAYHAINFACRHPHLVNRTLGLSGYYDVKRWTEGYSDDNVYFNNPCDFLLHEHEPERLELLRRLDITLVAGSDDPDRSNTEYLSNILWDKGIWHTFRIWDGGVHDWPGWQQMIQLYLL